MIETEIVEVTEWERFYRCKCGTINQTYRSVCRECGAAMIGAHTEARPVALRKVVKRAKRLPQRVIDWIYRHDRSELQTRED